MYTLYYSPGACSMAVHVVLNEIGVPFTAEHISLKEARTAAFLAVNPRGSVPVLKDGDLIVREGGAILTYLLDKHKSPLLPQEGAKRAAALEWLMYCNASLHPAYGKAFFVAKNATDHAAKEQLMTAALDNVDAMWKELDAHLASSPFLAGDQPTAADILMSVIANWDFFARRPVIGPHVKRVCKAVTARPAYQKTLAEEHVEYKAAA